MTDSEGLTANSSFPVGSVYSWNGPICNVCGQGYVGQHKCKVSVLKDKIAEMQKKIDEIENSKPCCPPMTTAPIFPTVNPYPRWDTSSCPCRPENGGSGVCGCTLSGPQVIC